MNKQKNIAAFLIALYVLILCVYWLRLGFGVIPLREGLYLFTAGIAVCAGIFALHNYGFKNARTLTLIFLTAGTAYWFIGESFFSYYEYILRVDPFPSAADIFYLLGYPFLFFGLLNEIKLAQITWKKISKPIIFLFIITAVLLSLVVFYFGVFGAYDSAQSLLANAIAMSYGVGDLILILTTLMILILVWEFRGGKLSNVWLVVFASFVCTLIADILFAIFEKEYGMQIWLYKSLLDSFWIAGYLLFAYALFDFGFAIQDAYVKIKQFGKIANTEAK